MPDLYVTRRSTAQPIQPDPRLNAQVAEVERDGITAGARIQVGGFVASVGMQNIVMLSRAADAAFRVSPLGEDHYRAVLAAYGNLVANEIQALAIQGRPW